MFENPPIAIRCRSMGPVHDHLIEAIPDPVMIFEKPLTARECQILDRHIEFLLQIHNMPIM